MGTYAQGSLLFALGVLSVRLGLSDSVLAFIRPSHVPFLIVAGVIVAILGVIRLRVAALQGLAGGSADDEQESTEGHDHHGHGGAGPRIAWMLAAPMFAVVLVAPPPLGSFAAQRQSGAVTTQVSDSGFAPLPEVVDGAIPLGLAAFATRAVHEPTPLIDQPVRLTGFVSDVGTDATWTLTRFRMSCCAADGAAVSIVIRSDVAPPPIDQWVDVVGVIDEDAEVGGVGDSLVLPTLDAQSVTIVEAPEVPYEF